MSSAAVPDFDGKILAVIYGSGENDFEYLEAASFQSQAGRQFLVGTTISTPSRATQPNRICIAWDAVVAYYEFGTLEQCEQAIANWGEQAEKMNRWF